jgi:ferredoxin
VSEPAANGKQKVVLDQARCHGYGLCVTIHPEIFAVPPASPVAILIRDIVGDGDLDDVGEAVRVCPAQAISLVTADE